VDLKSGGNSGEKANCAVAQEPDDKNIKLKAYL